MKLTPRLSTALHVSLCDKEFSLNASIELFKDSDDPSDIQTLVSIEQHLADIKELKILFGFDS